jgi:peroxiredoxin
MRGLGAVIIVALALVVAGLGCGEQAGDNPGPGGVANPGQATTGPVELPNLVFETVEGEKLALDDFRGKVVIADFWSITCTGCVEGLEEYQATPELLSNPQVQIIAISRDRSAAAVKAFGEEKGWSFPLALTTEEINEELLRDEKAVLPQVRVIGPEGTLRYQLGLGEAGPERLLEIVEELLAAETAEEEAGQE